MPELAAYGELEKTMPPTAHTSAGPGLAGAGPCAAATFGRKTLKQAR